MPTDKDWKRRVRARMQKTGESYTTARAALLKKTPPKGRAAKKATGSGRTGRADDYAKLAGVADATIEAKTGRTWEGWVRALDREKAHEWPHRDIARHVHETSGISGWWSQTVTVGYERIKGLRAVGQRRGGSFEAGKSRTFAVPVARLFAAWHDPAQRRRWLDVEPVVRTAQEDRSLRMTWPDGTSVLVWFVAKGGAKAVVAITHEKLPGRAAVERAKAWWARRLDRLAAHLAP